jgi:hypothetical protein
MGERTGKRDRDRGQKTEVRREEGKERLLAKVEVVSYREWARFM